MSLSGRSPGKGEEARRRALGLHSLGMVDSRRKPRVGRLVEASFAATSFGGHKSGTRYLVVAMVSWYIGGTVEAWCLEAKTCEALTRQLVNFSCTPRITRTAAQRAVMSRISPSSLWCGNDSKVTRGVCACSCSSAPYV